MCSACEINRPDGELSELVILPHFAYVLPDETLAPATPCLAWCNECTAFVPAESITPIQEMNDWIAEASSPPYSERVRFVTNDHDWLRKRIIDKGHAQVRWRELRETPPKCLNCGSTNFRNIPDDRSVFNHPQNGNELTASFVFATTAIDHKLFLLDVDGNRIGETEYVP